MSASKKSKYLNLGIYDKEDTVSFLNTENGNMEIIDNYAETTDARLDSAEDGIIQNANDFNSLNDYVNIFRGIAEQADKDINEKIKQLENFSTQTNNKFTRIENMFPWVVRITKDNVDDLTPDKNYSHLKLNIPDFNDTDFEQNHRPIILLLDSVSGTHKDFSAISINNKADFYYMCYWRYNTFIPERGVIMLMHSPGAVLKTNILVPGDATETEHGYMSADDKKALDDLIKSNPFTGTPISITNNTDINSIKTSGLYYGIGTNTYPNVYAPTKKYTFFMLVFAMGAYINQSIYIVDTDYANRVVNRASYDTGATWTNWYDNVNSSNQNRTLINELREQVNGTELTDEDLNDITTNGIYYADTDNTVVSKPSGVNKFFMIVMTKDTSTVQLIFDVDTSAFILRSTNNGTNWRAYNYTSAINNNYNIINKKANYMVNQLRLDGNPHEWNISSKFDLTKAVRITVIPQISPLISNDVVLTSLGSAVVMPESTLNLYQNSNVIINDGTAVERELFSVSCRGGARQVSYYATDFVYNVGAPYIIKYYLYYKIDVKSNANHILEFSGDVPEVYYTAVNLSTNKVVANREKIAYTDSDLNFTYIVQIAQ